MYIVKCYSTLFVSTFHVLDISSLSSVVNIVGLVYIVAQPQTGDERVFCPIN